jgi:WD40 repeat protein
MIGSPSVEARAGPNPFVGPRPFELGERLHGREREISELHLRLNAERIVLLHSPSGAGKSSLVQAGLLPLLARSFDVWGPTRVNAEPAVPGTNRYVLSAVQGFEEGVPRPLRRPLEVLARQTLAGCFEKRPRRRSAPANVVLLFDQFEEILTVDPLAVEAKQEFFAQLGELLRNPRVWALFVLREDYLAPLDPYARQVPTHLKNRFRIDLLGLAAAREAMVEPALEGGREFPAVDELVHDLATMKVQQPDGTFIEETGQHVEPVQLQVVCRRLWDAMPAEDLSIDAEDLERFGDVTEALAAYYTDSVARISGGDPARERAIRDWFSEALITGGGIRGQVLREAGASGGLANGLIDQLRGTHLVRAETRAGATWYELAHDRLIEPVQRDNAAWREQHLADVQRRAVLWERQGRPPGLLLAGPELAEGERWAAENGARITEAERRFLAESRKAHEIAEQERRQARRIRRLAIGATVVGVLAVVACVLAAWQWRQAERQAAVAELQRKKADEARQAAKNSESHALAESAEALRARTAAVAAKTDADSQKVLAEQERDNARRAASRAHVEQAQNLLAAGRRREVLAYLAQAVRLDPENVVARGRVLSLLLELGYPIASVPLRHEETVFTALFSPDGRRLVTASWDGRVRTWDTATGKLLGEFRHVLGEFRHGHDRLSTAAFSPDGQRIVTGSEYGSVRLWDVTGRQLAEKFYDEAIDSAFFGPDGKPMVAASADRTVWLWDVETGERSDKPLSYPETITFLSFSPDGRRVVTRSEESPSAQLWDATTGGLIDKLPHESGLILSASFSPDSRRVITASRLGSTRLWDAEDGSLLQELPPQKGAVNSASFSPDGGLVVTASEDKAARLWDAATGKLLHELLGHKEAVNSASFSPDGRSVVTASDDKTARLWEVAPGKALGEPLRRSDWDGSTAQLSPDGMRVVVTSLSASWVGDVTTGKLLGKPLPRDGVDFKSFSPDGQRLAIAFQDGRVQQWDLAMGKPVGKPLPLLREYIRSASLSDDGQRLVITSRGTARLWDTMTGKPLGKPFPHEGQVTFAMLSPDGQRVMTASSDGTARLWNSAGKALGEPLRHDNEIYSASFSLDGQRVVTGSEDGTARLWDAATGKSLCEPIRHLRAVYSASFSPDGQRVVTASEDGTARLWDATTGKPLSAPLRHGGLRFASFTPDGQRVVTAVREMPGGPSILGLIDRRSTVFALRQWDVPTASAAQASALAEAAEVVGGFALTDLGKAEPIPVKERFERIAALRRLGQTAHNHQPAVASFLRWYFTPRFERTISPLSKMTVEEYIRTLRALGTEEARQEAEEAFPGHPLLAEGQP